MLVAILVPAASQAYQSGPRAEGPCAEQAAAGVFEKLRLEEMAVSYSLVTPDPRIYQVAFSQIDDEAQNAGSVFLVKVNTTTCRVLAIQRSGSR